MSNMYTPWTIATNDPRVVFDAHGKEVVTVHGHFDEAVPIAKFIALSCNGHDALLAVANKTLRLLSRLNIPNSDPNAWAVTELINALESAIAAAKGSPQ